MSRLLRLPPPRLQHKKPFFPEFKERLASEVQFLPYRRNIQWAGISGQIARERKPHGLQDVEVVILCRKNFWGELSDLQAGTSAFSQIMTATECILLRSRLYV
jgi:hypothetical protein